MTFDQSVVVAGARVQLLWGERLLVEFVGRTNMAVGRAPIPHSGPKMDFLADQKSVRISGGTDMRKKNTIPPRILYERRIKLKPFWQ